MKRSLFALVLALSTTALFAQALPSSDVVVQSIQFNGAPGEVATAQVVRGQDDNGMLYIIHGKGDNKKVILINDKLYLPEEQYPDFTELKILSTNSVGSLMINVTNEHLGIGRYVYTTKLTIAYRQNAYRLVGFTNSNYDKLDPEAAQSCDYNLITGRGIKNSKKIVLKSRMPELQILKEEHVVDCKSFK